MKQIFLITFLVGLVAANYGDVEEFRRSLVMEAFMETVSHDESKNHTFKTSMKKLCDDLGDEGSYTKFETAFEEFQTCVQGVVAANPKPDTNVASENILYGCRLAPDIEKCIHALALSTESCLPVIKRDNAEKLKDMTKSFISYGCDNDAANIINFFSNQGFSCMQEKMPQLHQCIDDADNEQDSLESVDKISEFQESDCKEIADVRKCLNTQFETCPTEAANKLTNGLFDILEKYSCSNVTAAVSELTVPPVLIAPVPPTV